MTAARDEDLSAPWAAPVGKCTCCGDGSWKADDIGAVHPAAPSMPEGLPAGCARPAKPPATPDTAAE